MFHTEREFVRWLQARTAPKSSGLKLGIGDDAALISAGPKRDYILTADLSIEGVHYLYALHPARAVGHRALARSLSDIAAMGGRPRFALLSMAFPRAVQQAWIEEFFDGLLSLARRYKVEVIGGDTAVVARGGLVDISVVGEAAPGKALRRSGARPGDQIYVSGVLGRSALGFEILKSQSRRPGRAAGPPQESKEARAAVQAHLYPEPRCALGSFLGRKGLASALLDISDGLSLDLARLCEASGVGATIEAERIPGPGGCPPDKSLRLALDGGEDYELLFTVSPRKILPARFENLPLRRIGEITRSLDRTLVRRDGKRQPLAAAGWDHFSRSA